MDEGGTRIAIFVFLILFYAPKETRLRNICDDAEFNGLCIPAPVLTAYSGVRSRALARNLSIAMGFNRFVNKKQAATGKPKCG